MRYVLFVIAALLLSACGNNEKRPPCTTQESCLNDPNCLCWCSQKCGFRKKQKIDHPMYIENDAYGKFCYCKQWDLDFYDENCINGESVKQPPNAK